MPNKTNPTKKAKIEEDILSETDKEAKSEIEQVLDETPVEEKKEKKPKDDVLELIKKLEDKIAEATKTNAMLLEVADEKKLANYYARNAGSIPKVVRLREINGNVIIGWKTIVDEVSTDPATGRWYENQQVEVLFEDGSTRQMHLLEFNRAFGYIKANVISTMVDQSTQSTALKVKRIDNGKEYDISITFIN